MDHESIRLLTRDKLEDGRLPHDSVTKAWGGPSDGEICSVCDTVLAVDQLVMEGTTQGRRKLHFHVRCFQIWEDERRTPRAHHRDAAL